ncbi:MAG: hypothetical protein R2932_00765 [Caldilineaceae bacterium]
MHSDNQSTILRPQLLKLLSAVLLPLLAGALLTGCTIGDGEAVRRLQPAAEVAVAPAAPPSPTGADVAFQPADGTLATAPWSMG